MAITPLPPAPDRATPATFANLGDALLSALPTFVTQANALQTDVNAKQVSATTQVSLATTQATNSAASAAAAAASSASTIWVSGTTYAIGNVRFSPVNFQNYRRKTAGAGTTDPSTDTTNWGILATIPTVIGDASKFLQSNGTTLAWADPIPAQTGNSGKFLTTDGTVSSFGALPSSGGTTITGSVTLAVSSAGSMTVTPATHGLYVTLPVATTCGKSAVVFSIFNAGDYDYGIKNSAGTQLGWILSGSNSIIGLSDNATAAGIWNISNLCKIGVTARKDLSLLNINVKQHIALDSTRSLIIFTASSLLYGIIYNSSTQSWGSATIIRNAVVAYSQSLLIAADKVLVISYIASSTAMETVVLSIAGTAITVNTAVATTLAGTFIASSNLVAVGTSFVATYKRNTTVTGLRAITVSGTVPTVGAEIANVTNDLGGFSQLFVTGSTVRLVVTTATVISVSPYTVSGATLTAGTEASALSTAATIRAFQNAAGNIVCLYLNTVLTAAIFKLTATTEAVTTVALHASLGAANPTALSGIDFYAISATKTGIFAAGNGSYIANILVDTTGTASAGTAITGAGAGVLSTFNTTTANTLKAAFFTTQSGQMLTFNCSGTSPTLTATTALTPINPTGSHIERYATPAAGGSYVQGEITKKSYQQLVIGDTTICTGAWLYGRDSIFTKNGLILNAIANFGVYNGQLSFSGINTNQAWTMVSAGEISTLIQVDGAAA